MRHMLLDAQRFLKILFHLKKDSLGILISSARMVMRGWERGKEGVGRLFQDGFQVSAGSTPRPKKKVVAEKASHCLQKQVPNFVDRWRLP